MARGKCRQARPGESYGTPAQTRAIAVYAVTINFNDGLSLTRRPQARAVGLPARTEIGRVDFLLVASQLQHLALKDAAQLCALLDG